MLQQIESELPHLRTSLLTTAARMSATDSWLDSAFTHTLASDLLSRPRTRLPHVRLATHDFSLVRQFREARDALLIDGRTLFLSTFRSAVAVADTIRGILSVTDPHLSPSYGIIKVNKRRAYGYFRHGEHLEFDEEVKRLRSVIPEATSNVVIVDELHSLGYSTSYASYAVASALPEDHRGHVDISVIRGSWYGGLSEITEHEHDFEIDEERVTVPEIAQDMYDIGQVLGRLIMSASAPNQH